MCTATLTQHKVIVLTTTDNDCARICFCEELRKRGCDVTCVDQSGFLKQRRDPNYSVLIDAVDPARLPEANAFMHILASVHPRPRAVAILLPDQDYKGLTRFSLPIPVRHHFHKDGAPLDPIFDFLAIHHHE